MEAPPPPPPPPPGSGVKPETPPRPGRRVVSEGSSEAISADEASGVLDDIRAALGKAKDARVTLSWRIEGEDA